MIEKVSKRDGSVVPFDESRIYSAISSAYAEVYGELTEEMIVAQLEAIARQARAGFVDGPGFPVFASLNCNTEEGK